MVVLYDHCEEKHNWYIVNHHNPHPPTNPFNINIYNKFSNDIKAPHVRKPYFTSMFVFDISGKISKDRKTMTSIIKGRCTVILENGAKFKLDSGDNVVLKYSSFLKVKCEGLHTVKEGKAIIYVYKYYPPYLQIVQIILVFGWILI